jgi:hypothetical protein
MAATSKPKCGECAKFEKCFAASPSLKGMTPEKIEAARKAYAGIPASVCFEEKRK